MHPQGLSPRVRSPTLLLCHCLCVVKQVVTGGRLTRIPEKGHFSVSWLRQLDKYSSKTANYKAFSSNLEIYRINRD